MEVKIQHYWRRRRNQNRLLLCRLLRAVPNGFTCLGPIVLETMLLLFVVNHLFSFLGLHTSTHFQTVIPTSGVGLACSLLSSARRFNFSFFKNFLVGKKGDEQMFAGSFSPRGAWLARTEKCFIVSFGAGVLAHSHTVVFITLFLLPVWILRGTHSLFPIDGSLALSRLSSLRVFSLIFFRGWDRKRQIRHCAR